MQPTNVIALRSGPARRDAEREKRHSEQRKRLAIAVDALRDVAEADPSTTMGEWAKQVATRLHMQVVTFEPMDHPTRPRRPEGL